MCAIDIPHTQWLQGDSHREAHGICICIRFQESEMWFSSLVGVVCPFVTLLQEDSYVVGRPALQSLESPQTQVNRPVLDKILREPLHSGFFNRLIARSLANQLIDLTTSSSSVQLAQSVCICEVVVSHFTPISYVTYLVHLSLSADPVSIESRSTSCIHPKFSASFVSFLSVFQISNSVLFPV